MRETNSTRVLALALVASLGMTGAGAAQDTAEEAQAMLERAEAMRAEADAMAEKANAFLAEMAAAAESEEEEATETAEAETGGEEMAEGGEVDNVSVAYSENGKYFTEDDVPTFFIADDGTVDWYTFSGFRRYHAECHVCHGPDGEGSTYAPALKDSAVNMDYYDFFDVVVNGRKVLGANENSVMPVFGDNPNVMCYLDDIYVYLKARGTGELARGRPPKKEAKTDAYREDEDACMG